MSPSGGRRTGAGRPPKPPEERRARSVAISLTGAEYERLRALADGEPLAIYVKRLVVRHLDRKLRKGGTK